MTVMEHLVPNHTVSNALKPLFTMFDANGDGTIDLREFLVGLSVLVGGSSREKLAMV
jgi:hypothetical protein